MSKTLTVAVYIVADGDRYLVHYDDEYVRWCLTDTGTPALFATEDDANDAAKYVRYADSKRYAVARGGSKERDPQIKRAYAVLQLIDGAFQCIRLHDLDDRFLPATITVSTW